MQRVLIALGLYLLYNKFAKAKNLVQIADQVQVGLADVKVKKSAAGLFSTTIYPVLSVFNPTNNSASLDRIAGTLTLNGSTVGTYNVSNVNITPGNNSIEVPVVLSNTSVLQVIIAALTGNGQTLSYGITGNITTGAVSATFKDTYQIGGKSTGALTTEPLTPAQTTTNLIILPGQPSGGIVAQS